MRIFCSLLAAAFVAVFPLAAQERPGSLSGKVVDVAGAPLPGARVVAEGPARREAYAGADGGFRIPALPPGGYRVTASLAGFREARSAVTVAAGSGATVSLALAVGLREDVVVTASRMETGLADTPATVTVLSAAQLERAPATSWADVLRTVPGVNATQTSAREVNVSSRQAAAFFSGGQLALVDGRPLFFDFFNVVFWDMNSVGIRDLDQVEVLRGPASVMWGANAATGVVNLITKPPRETPGVEVTLSGGLFSRPEGSDGSGGLWAADARWAGELSEKLSARLSAGYTRSQAFARPEGYVFTGEAPLAPGVVVGGGSFADVRYPNAGTSQPRVDLRVDQQLGETGLVSYSAGYSGTEGILQTPIGPFGIERGAGLAYGRIAYSSGGFHLTAFGNYVKGTAPNLVTVTPSGEPLRIDFKNGQYDLDGGYNLTAGRHSLGAGANVRYNSFDLDIAPTAGRRVDVGAWVQDQVDFEAFRVAVGVRLDKPESLANALVAPRLAVAYTPAEGHVFRASYSRGYWTPSAVENDLDIALVGGYLPLDLIDPRLTGQRFPIVLRTEGNRKLSAESLDAWEISWQGRVAGGQYGVAAYLNDSHDVISSNGTDAALVAAGIEPNYTSANPPPGWPLPPEVIDLLAQRGIVLPRESIFLNLGSVRNQGIELSMTQPVTQAVSIYANYSFQATPQLRDAVGDPRRPKGETVAVPPRHRLNLGATVQGARAFGSVAVAYADKAYWADVLNPAFYGWTGSYVMLNASAGIRWAGGAVTTTLRGTNLTGEKVQQHIFGDVLGRTVALDLGLSF